ncbi:hypothetical protein HMPREF1635_05790 [Clostridiales bacterium S5-A14a]|nr:hypothetical protein HMPREF1635_05790 [Clostridiales bacterium S5-A14a]
MNKTQIKKIISIILIIVVVGILFGLYTYKNLNKSSTDTNKVSSEAQNSSEGSSSSKDGGNSNNTIETDKPIDYNAIFKEGKPLILVFGSEDCDACHKLKPVLQALSDKYDGEIYIKYVDIVKHPDSYDNYKFQYIPSLIFFKNDGTPYIPPKEYIDEYDFEVPKDDSGKVKYTLHQGVLPKDILENMIQELI